MKRIILILGLIITTHSCIFIRMDDSIDLGSKYRYVQDYPQSILYHKSEEYKGSGVNAVPPIVLSYDFNEKYIIAKNKDMDNEQINYWIIDKEKKYSEIQPLDSLTFFRELENKNIELK